MGWDGGVMDEEGFSCNRWSILITDRGSSACASHPAKRPELGAKRGDQVCRVLRVVGLDKVVIVVVIGRLAV
jgi:hypothetical protein